MKKYLRLLRLLFIVSGCCLSLSGCYIGYSFRGPGYDSENARVIEHTENQLFLAITHGTINTGEKTDFSKSLQKVKENLSTTPGLIGYSVRKEIFGNEVWTMSAWISEEALTQFLEGRAHRDAVAKGGIPPAKVRSAYTWIPAKRLPISWEYAQQLLEENE